jgi:hypothetical protein
MYRREIPGLSQLWTEFMNIYKVKPLYVQCNSVEFWNSSETQSAHWISPDGRFKLIITKMASDNVDPVLRPKYAPEQLAIAYPFDWLASRPHPPPAAAVRPQVDPIQRLSSAASLRRTWQRSSKLRRRAGPPRPGFDQSDRRNAVESSWSCRSRWRSHYTTR